MTTYLRCLTIAGSDSGGGAGIQADIKTFQALGCYGMSVITALTAQNTCEVKSIYPVSPAFVSEQLHAVVEDIGTDAIKIGMIGSLEIIRVVASCIRKLKLKNIVLDPVMVSKSGSELLEPKAVSALKAELIPLVDIVTPNIPEAEILVGMKINSRDAMVEAGEALREISKAIVLKGGHTDSEVVSDLIMTSGTKRWIEKPRIVTKNTHGTGCTYSAAIAAYKAKGFDWTEAVTRARNYLHEAIKHGSQRQIGHGQGPVDHSWNIEVKA